MAVLSGKGGTGKTTVSTCLSKYLKFSYVDADVEEPNGHVFLKPKIDVNEEVLVEVPVINEAKCSCCGQCSKVCQFNAIAVTLKKVIVFNELCHGCKACSIICHSDAILFSRKIAVKHSKGESILDFLEVKNAMKAIKNALIEGGYL